MSQINNGMKIYDSKSTLPLNVKTYEEQLKWLLAKRDYFPNFEIFKTVFVFF